MKKVKSKVDEKTTYHVTDKYITILRDGESATVKYSTLEQFASRLKEGIKDELLAIRLEHKGRVCPLCETLFYKAKSNIYCSPECSKEANRRNSLKYQKALKKSNSIEPDIRISNAGEIEREARKKGLRYADIQKAETLAMIGRIDTTIKPKPRFIIYD